MPTTWLSSRISLGIASKKRPLPHDGSKMLPDAKPMRESPLQMASATSGGV